MRSLLLLSCIALAACGASGGGVDPSPKIAVVEVSLDNGEQLTYRGTINPQLSPFRFPASTTVTNVANPSDVCATRLGQPIAQPRGDNTRGVGTIYCNQRSWTIPVDVSPYPANNGDDTGVVLGPGGQEIGTYSMVWQDT